MLLTSAMFAAAAGVFDSFTWRTRRGAKGLQNASALLLGALLASAGCVIVPQNQRKHLADPDALRTTP